MVLSLARRVAIVAAIAIVATSVGAQDAVQEPDELQAGIRHIQNGEYEVGLLAIDGAVRKLETNVERWRELLITAHLYQGLALLGLRDTGLAHTKLLRAAELDPSYQIDPTEFPPRLIREFDRARTEVLAQRKGRGIRLPLILAGGAAVAAGGLAIALRGGDESDGEPSVDLRLNGQDGGTFPCSSGLFFTIAVTNPTSEVLHVEGFSLNLSALSAPCLSHDAPVDGTVTGDVPAGATEEIRRVDLAGDLCRTPGHVPGCEWRASVLVVTEAGTLGDQVEFSTRP